MSGRHYVLLTDDEILLLDGKTESEEIIGKIKVVKDRRSLESDGVPEWFAPVIVSATRTGKLDISNREGYDCLKCGRKAIVYPVYLRGHKKGQRNHNKKSWRERRVVVGGAHFCQACYRDSVVHEIDRLVEAGETRFEIAGKKSKVAKENKRICPKCEKECWDFDMGLEYTLMGNGRYYGKCPHCGFQSCLFGPSFSSTGEFRVSRIADLKEVKVGWFAYYQRKKKAEAVDE